MHRNRLFVVKSKLRGKAHGKIVVKIKPTKKHKRRNNENKHAKKMDDKDRRHMISDK
jgi:hypothetical protein